eukprot:Awhi_evm2s14201
MSDNNNNTDVDNEPQPPSIENQGPKNDVVNAPVVNDNNGNMDNNNNNDSYIFQVQIRKSKNVTIVNLDISMGKRGFNALTFAAEIYEKLKATVEWRNLIRNQRAVQYEELTTTDSIHNHLRIKHQTGGGQDEMLKMRSCSFDELNLQLQNILNRRSTYTGTRRTGNTTIVCIINSAQRSTAASREAGCRTAVARIEEENLNIREGLEMDYLIQDQSRSRTELPFAQSTLRNRAIELDIMQENAIRDANVPVDSFEIPVQNVSADRNTIQNGFLRFNRQDLIRFYGMVYPILYPERMTRPIQQNLPTAAEVEQRNDNVRKEPQANMPDMEHHGIKNVSKKSY